MRIYLFPIETTARELDHKVLMATKVIDKNIQVIVGDQQYIRILSFFLKGGVFFGKHLFGKPKFSDRGYFNRLKKNFFNIVHLNEEGAVWPGEEDTWEKLMISSERPSVLHPEDYLVTWGEWQKRFNLSYERPQAQIIATGHPRFDLYRKAYSCYFKNETNQLLEEFGDFILVNTSFSYSNNGEGGTEFIFKKTLSYDTSNESDRFYRFGRWYNQMLSMASIVKLINELSLKFPKKVIVLRPHPSEDTGYYESIFQNIDNVKVIYQGSVTPWLLASKLVIHNGCTTAIEATLAGKPVINFNPSAADESSNVYLASVCGTTFSSIEDIINYIENDELSVEIPDDLLANDLFENFTEHNSADRVAIILDRAMPENSSDFPGLNRFTFFISKLAFFSYLIAKRVYYFSRGENKKYVDYKKRFETFERYNIDSKLNSMSQILSKKVKMKSFFSHGFVVENRE